MPKTKLQQLTELGQSIWMDPIQRFSNLLRDGLKIEIDATLI